MAKHTDVDDALEALIGRVTADQPPVAAPATLEYRVLAALADRAALPWWHLSFLHWPHAVQAIFLVAVAGCVHIALLLWDRVSSVMEASPATPLVTSLGTTLELAASLLEAGRAISGGIPELWSIGGAVVLVLLYGLLFGLGAFGYRVFRHPR